MVETYQHTAAQPPIRSWGAAHVRLALCRLPFDVERDLYRTRVGDAQQDRAEMDGRWEVEEDRSLPALRQPALLDALHKVRCRVLGYLGRNAQQVVVVDLRREEEEESGGRRCGEVAVGGMQAQSRSSRHRERGTHLDRRHRWRRDHGATRRAGPACLHSFGAKAGFVFTNSHEIR